MIAQDLWQANKFANKFAEEIHKIKRKCGHDHRKCETHGIKYKDCECCLEYANIKDDLREYNCLCCNKNDQNKFDGKLKNRFANTHKFSSYDINKFIAKRFLPM